MTALARAALAVAVWGASFVATKIALRELTPVALVWIRFAMGVALLGAVVFARGQFRPVGGRDLATFSFLGFLGITLHQWLQSNGLVTSQATTTGWIVATIPLFIALLGRVFLGERLGRAAILGILLSALGVLLVVGRGDLQALAGMRIGTPGDVLILLSAPNWAVFSILSRHGLKRHSAALMMFYVMMLGWLFTSALFVAESGWQGIGRLSPAGFGAVLFLGLLCSGIAYVFWYDALERIPASQVGVLLYLEPLVTVAVAALVLGESIRAGTMIGGAFILFGIWLVNRARAPGAGRRGFGVGESG